jgi:arylsulfatase A-like enzyme
MAEDMSARVGAFGDEVAVTPNIDKLAKRAVRYPNTFTAAGVCAPSRAAHILGMHQISVGAQHMRTQDFKLSDYLAVPPAHVKAFPELLRAGGYYTFTNNKLDYQFSRYPAHSGPFTIWDVEGKRGHWRNVPKDKPFFGFITIETTHESRMFADKVEKNRQSKGWQEPVLAESVIVPPFLADTPEMRSNVTQHYNNIHNMDRQVGRLLAELQEDGLLDSTIVVWTTDHGDGLPRAKREIYDSGIKVPMLVAWPENSRPKHLRPNSEVKKLISFVDFAPTFLQIAGVKAPNYIQGKAHFGYQNIPPREYIYASKDRLDEFAFRERAVRSASFKYIRNYMPNRPGAVPLSYREQLSGMGSLWKLFKAGKLNKAQAFWFNPRPAEELYNVLNDPFELNNLANDGQYQAELARLRKVLDSRLNIIGDESRQPELALAQLSWPNGQQPITEPAIIRRNGEMISLSSATLGASLGYQIDNGPWQLYQAPIAIESGRILKAKAVRYGWKESPVLTNF